MIRISVSSMFVLAVFAAFAAPLGFRVVNDHADSLDLSGKKSTFTVTAPSATERLRTRLLEIGRSDKFIYAWSTSWWGWNDHWYGKFRQHAGVMPAMYFCEFRDICGTWNSREYYEKYRTKLKEIVKRDYRERGAIPLVTWHLENPYIPPRWGADKDGQGFRYRYVDPGYPQEHRNVLREIAQRTGSPCGSGRVDGVPGKIFPNPREWYEWILKDMLAFWRTVRDDEGRPIPIIIRPFHEMDGDWFWWGPGSSTPQDYIAVYRLTVDMIRKELGSENVLFCYGPDRLWNGIAGEEGKSGYLKWYPGDEYVDMLAIDDYSIGKGDTVKSTEKAIERLRVISEIGRKRGKFCGIAECGAKDSSDDFYSIIHRVMTAPGVDFAIAATYDGPWTFPESEAGKADMRRFFQRPEVLSGDVLMAFCSAEGAALEERIVSLAAPDGAELVFCGEDIIPAFVPFGEQYTVANARVNKNGVETSLKRRVPSKDGRTVYGRLNALLDGKKKARSEHSIALVALPGASAKAVSQSGSAWSVPVINLSEGKGLSAKKERPACVSLSSVRPNDWRGKRVAFLGDSITDVRHIGCTSNYWNFLERDLGIVPLVYGINGHQWKHVFAQAEKLYAAHSNNVDEIVIFAGTNDYNANVPLGDWSDGEKSFRGRIAAVMDCCERRFPGVTVWLMTPIHRGYATFGAKNVQPDESYANTVGMWISDYVDVVKEAAAKWSSARLIDLYAETGLYPLEASHAKFFHNANTDMLHPNTAGHERIARVMMRRLRFGNATELVRSCISALPEEGGVLYFAKDTYHFYEDGSKTMWLDPSNNQSGEKRVVFPLAGRRNVTIDGCGSTFVFHGRTFPFAATNGIGLTFRNFTVTTRYPSCAGFTVTAKDCGGFTVKFDEGVCPYKVENGHLTFMLDGCPVSTRDGRFSLHALDRLCISYLMAPDSPGDKSSFPASFAGARIEDRGNREVRFTYYGDKHPKCRPIPYSVGERVAVNLEEKRYRDVFFFEDCRDVNIENVSIRRFGGMGLVAQRSGNIKVEGLRAIPPKGERVTLTADILQFINCYGQVSIVGCEGGHSLDDWINIHGNYLRILSVEGRCLKVKPQHRSQQGFFPYRAGDRIECLTAHSREVTASARVLSVERDAADASVAVITVDGDIAGTASVGQLVENATLNPDVTIRNNRFVNFPHLRLSGRGKYLVEGNRFQECLKAVHGMDLADYWFESGRISDMAIRSNEIVNGGGFSFGLSGWGDGDTSAPKIHGRILLENNTFKSVKGKSLSAAGVRELIDRDGRSGR